MLEKLLVRHCAPTLAGIKTGSLFSFRSLPWELLRQELCRLNNILSDKGLRILPLKKQGDNVLIYLYRPDRLKEDMERSGVCSLLSAYGYCCHDAHRCVLRLMERLSQGKDFPHEIGLFLGYPPEDVWGFILHGADSAKYRGLWKVYGDEDKARRVFACYKNCTDIYLRRFARNGNIAELAVK